MRISLATNVYKVKNREEYSCSNASRLSFAGDVFLKSDLAVSAKENVQNQMQKSFSIHKNPAKLKQNLESYALYDNDLGKDLPEILSSLDFKQTKLDEISQQKFFSAVDEICAPDSEFSRINYNDLGWMNIDLTYPRKDFVDKLVHILIQLPENEQQKIKNHFGFDLVENEYGFHFEGYPNVPQNKINTDANVYADVSQEIEKFTRNNAIFIKNQPEVTAQFNDIIQAVPEFLTTVGKKQHKTHDYTVDIHTLKVLHDVVNNPRFQSLPLKNKELLFLATLLHDIAKSENIGLENQPDHGHAKKSAFDTYFILNKFDMPEQDKNSIFELIYNHDWLQQYTNTLNPVLTMQKIADDFSTWENFDMACVLTKADLKGVKDNDVFYNRFGGALLEAEPIIKKLILAKKDNIV